jgi:hypothetical protein
MDRSLFGKYQQPPKNDHRTERGDLFDQILAKLNPSRIKAGYKPMTHSRLGYLLEGIKTPDIYYIISTCNLAERDGYPWSAIFYNVIRPTPPQQSP